MGMYLILFLHGNAGSFPKLLIIWLASVFFPQNEPSTLVFVVRIRTIFDKFHIGEFVSIVQVLTSAIKVPKAVVPRLVLGQIELPQHTQNDILQSPAILDIQNFCLAPTVDDTYYR